MHALWSGNRSAEVRTAPGPRFRAWVLLIMMSDPCDPGVPFLEDSKNGAVVEAIGHTGGPKHLAAPRLGNACPAQGL